MVGLPHYRKGSIPKVVGKHKLESLGKKELIVGYDGGIRVESLDLGGVWSREKYDKKTHCVSLSKNYKKMINKILKHNIT